jgi:thiamine biosynthesis lipoprotein
MMGTYARVVSDDKRAADIAFAQIQRIEVLLSKYLPESEVSRLNREGWVKASPDTFYILRRAGDFYSASGGAFDVTVGGLADLWGFTDKKYKLPDKSLIAAKLKLVGMDKIIFNNADNVIKFSVSGMKIDLGAIAKGYAVDCAVRELKKAGVKNCLVAVGGEIYCLGSNRGRPWRKKGLLDKVKLRDRAISTSGDYEQYFIKGNRRYAHIFNPKTGYPASSGVIAVTVIAEDCLSADALATSIFVLGKIKGEELAKKFPATQVKIIEEKDVQNN